MKLDLQLFETVPDLKLGINHYTKITVSESPQMLKGRLQLFQEQLFFELEEKPVTDFPGLKNGEQYGNHLAQIQIVTGIPQKHLCDESKTKLFQPFHSAVDLNNFFSLQYEIPAGIYDFSEDCR